MGKESKSEYRRSWTEHYPEGVCFGGHDSGHPDYGHVGERIGGVEDMNTLIAEGQKLGALFGVHINASEMYTEAKAFSNDLSAGNYGWNWLDQGWNQFLL